MYEHREDFGYLIIHSSDWESTKKMELQFREKTSGEKMVKIAISIAKNEMDIIESFVRHTLSFADELLLLDHQSTDKTPEILRALQQEFRRRGSRQGCRAKE